MGRYGNVMLINGETNYQLNATKGEVIRFYLTNAANARPFNFGVKGTKLKLVGGDAGATEREEWKDSVILGPSERVVVEVLLADEGMYLLNTLLQKRPILLGVYHIQMRLPHRTTAIFLVSFAQTSVKSKY